MPSLLGRLAGLSFRSELLIMNLLGLVNSTLDWSPLKWTNQLEKIWNLSLSQQSLILDTIGEHTIKTILSWVVITRILIAHVYTFSYLTNIYPILTWSRPNLLLPWLVLSFFKNVFLEVIIIVIGLLLWYERRFSIILFLEFIVVKIVPLILASYNWYSNSCLFLQLRRMEKMRRLRRTMKSDSHLTTTSRMAARIEESFYRHRTKSWSTLLSYNSDDTCDSQDTIYRVLDDTRLPLRDKVKLILGLTEEDIQNARERAKDRSWAVTEMDETVVKNDVTLYLSLDNMEEEEITGFAGNPVTLKSPVSFFETEIDSHQDKEVPAESITNIEDETVDDTEKLEQTKKREGEYLDEFKKIKQMKLTPLIDEIEPGFDFREGKENMFSWRINRNSEKGCCDASEKIVCGLPSGKNDTNFNKIAESQTNDFLRSCDCSKQMRIEKDDNTAPMTSTPKSSEKTKTETKYLDLRGNIFNQHVYTYNFMSVQANPGSMENAFVKRMFDDRYRMQEVFEDSLNQESLSFDGSPNIPDSTTSQVSTGESIHSNVTVDECVSSVETNFGLPCSEVVKSTLEKVCETTEMSVGSSKFSEDTDTSSSRETNSCSVTSGTEKDETESIFEDTNIPIIVKKTMKAFDGWYEENFAENSETQCLLRQMEKKNWNVDLGPVFSRREGESNEAKDAGCKDEALDLRTDLKSLKEVQVPHSESGPVQPKKMTSKNVEIQTNKRHRVLPGNADSKVPDRQKRKWFYRMRCKSIKDKAQDLPPKTHTNSEIKANQSTLKSSFKENLKPTPGKPIKAIMKTEKPQNLTKSSSSDNGCFCTIQNFDSNTKSSTSVTDANSDRKKDRKDKIDNFGTVALAQTAHTSGFEKLTVRGKPPVYPKKNKTDTQSRLEMQGECPRRSPKSKYLEQIERKRSMDRQSMYSSRSFKSKKLPESQEEREAREMKALRAYNEVTLLADKRELEKKRDSTSGQSTFSQDSKNSANRNAKRNRYSDRGRKVREISYDDYLDKENRFDDVTIGTNPIVASSSRNSSDKRELENKGESNSVQSTFSQDSKNSANRNAKRNRYSDRGKKVREISYDDYLDKENRFDDVTIGNNPIVASSSRNSSDNADDGRLYYGDKYCSMLMKIDRVTGILLDEVVRIHGNQERRENRKSRGTGEIDARKPYTKYSKPRKPVDDNPSATSNKKVEGIQKGRELERTPAKEDVREPIRTCNPLILDELPRLEITKDNRIIESFVRKEGKVLLNAVNVTDRYEECDPKILERKDSFENLIRSHQLSDTLELIQNEDNVKLEVPLQNEETTNLVKQTDQGFHEEAHKVSPLNEETAEMSKQNHNGVHEEVREVLPQNEETMKMSEQIRQGFREEEKEVPLQNEEITKMSEQIRQGFREEEKEVPLQNEETTKMSKQIRQGFHEEEKEVLLQNEESTKVVKQIYQGFQKVDEEEEEVSLLSKESGRTSEQIHQDLAKIEENVEQNTEDVKDPEDLQPNTASQSSIPSVFGNELGTPESSEDLEQILRNQEPTPRSVLLHLREINSNMDMTFHPQGVILGNKNHQTTQNLSGSEPPYIVEDTTAMIVHDAFYNKPEMIIRIIIDVSSTAATSLQESGIFGEILNSGSRSTSRTTTADDFVCHSNNEIFQYQFPMDDVSEDGNQDENIDHEDIDPETSHVEETKDLEDSSEMNVDDETMNNNILSTLLALIRVIRMNGMDTENSNVTLEIFGKTSGDIDDSQDEEEMENDKEEENHDHDDIPAFLTNDILTNIDFPIIIRKSDVSDTVLDVSRTRKIQQIGQEACRVIPFSVVDEEDEEVNLDETVREKQRPFLTTFRNPLELRTQEDNLHGLFMNFHVDGPLTIPPAQIDQVPCTSFQDWSKQSRTVYGPSEYCEIHTKIALNEIFKETKSETCKTKNEVDVEDVLEESSDFTDKEQEAELKDFNDEDNKKVDQNPLDIEMSSHRDEENLKTDSTDEETLPVTTIVMFWLLVFWIYVRHLYYTVRSFSTCSTSTMTMRLFDVHTIPTVTSRLFDRGEHVLEQEESIPDSDESSTTDGLEKYDNSGSTQEYFEDSLDTKSPFFAKSETKQKIQGKLSKPVSSTLDELPSNIEFGKLEDDPRPEEFETEIRSTDFLFEPVSRLSQFYLHRDQIVNQSLGLLDDSVDVENRTFDLKAEETIDQGSSNVSSITELLDNFANMKIEIEESPPMTEDQLAHQNEQITGDATFVIQKNTIEEPRSDLKVTEVGEHSTKLTSDIGNIPLTFPPGSSSHQCDSFDSIFTRSSEESTHTTSLGEQSPMEEFSQETIVNSTVSNDSVGSSN